VELASRWSAGGAPEVSARFRCCCCIRCIGVILFDPIFQGLAISLMAGEVASLLLSRLAVPVLYYMAQRHERTELVATTAPMESAA
jgi:hypothetical protein